MYKNIKYYLLLEAELFLCYVCALCVNVHIAVVFFVFPAGYMRLQVFIKVDITYFKIQTLICYSDIVLLIAA